MQATTEITTDQLQQLLQKRFGFSEFRKGQLEAIEALLQQRRVLCIQPTGHGKSLLYQLPSLLLDGITLVISPLLALVRDQLSHLNQRFDIGAAAINTDQSEEENEQAKSDALSGKIRILFIAPEQLNNLNMQQVLQQLPVSLLVVDEAHCISTWGHDFRPSYRQIVELLRFYQDSRPDLRVLGITATADRKTELDIAKQLQAADSPPLVVLRETMDRPNIKLAVYPVSGLAQKLSILKQVIQQTQGSGILYCATRDQTETVANYLQSQGLDVLAYHAGFHSEKKRELQETFINDGCKAIAATNALGMGIDKPNIRFIVHVDFPGSITSYYQEVGRAGRDGQMAKGLLLFDPGDGRIQEHFISSAQPSAEDFTRLQECVRKDAQEQWPNQTKIKVDCGLHPTRVTIILAELSEQGFLEKKLIDKRQVYLPTGKAGAPDLARYINQRQVREKELSSIVRYGQKQVDCLMQHLRTMLGDRDAQPCGHCIICQGQHWPDYAADCELETLWLQNRHITLPESKRPAHCPGLALLNSEEKSPLFLAFMRSRASRDAAHIAAEMQQTLKQHIAYLSKEHDFSLLIPMPSSTWAQREKVAQQIAGQLKIPIGWKTLQWKNGPDSRQGELKNNDQRRYNVAGKMSVTENLEPYTPGTILLLDDYYGSGATVREATRALRKEGLFEGDIVPLTMAKVRWRLGRSGIV